jgi:hypothetical protein
VGEHPSSSPLLASPGGSTDSCLTVNMSSPFPLHLSGSASLNPFAAATHNTMASFKSTSQSLQTLSLSVLRFVDCCIGM